MRVATLEKELESEKRKFLSSKANIKKLRQKIAALKCPYRIGDIIQIKEEGVVYQVKVKYIDFAVRYREIWGPKPESETTWRVCGDKKFTRGWKAGWRISTSGFSKLVNGIHVNKKTPIQEWMRHSAFESELSTYNAGF